MQPDPERMSGSGMKKVKTFCVLVVDTIRGQIFHPRTTR